MARLPRYFIEGQPHHVIQRGNNRVAVFASERDRTFFLSCLEEAAIAHGVAIHAYVLMTTHVHLLATPTTRQSLPKTMQSVGRRYVQRFNVAQRRTGTLWEGRYRGTLIDSERYFLTCMRYIELNPVRAGMVARPGDYRWSSYRANAFGLEDALVTPHAIYQELGGTKGARELAYRQLSRQPLLIDDVDAIRQSTNTAWALGSDQFRARIETASGRRAAPRLCRHARPVGSDWGQTRLHPARILATDPESSLTPPDRVESDPTWGDGCG